MTNNTTSAIGLASLLVSVVSCQEELTLPCALPLNLHPYKVHPWPLLRRTKHGLCPSLQAEVPLTGPSRPTPSSSRSPWRSCLLLLMSRSFLLHYRECKQTSLGGLSLAFTSIYKIICFQSWNVLGPFLNS